MTITLPPKDHYILSGGDNDVVKNYGPSELLENYEIHAGTPFRITAGTVDYYFTSDKTAHLPEECQYVLLTSKKPIKKHFEEGTIKVERWLRHPLFQHITPEQIIASWKDRFKIIKEDTDNNVDGFRPPQLGVLYAILAHVQHAEDRAIVVMPTGTGKTEVMLASLVAIPCNKLLVTVPSDALRTQLFDKFLLLGLLKKFGIMLPEGQTPIVGIMRSKIQDRPNLEAFIERCNVIVTTMPLVTAYNDEYRTLFASRISHLFVDEAHHSEARTWSTFISAVNYKKVFLYTATPFRADDLRLQGKFIFNFPLKAAQEQRYYKRINCLPVREYDPEKADEKIAAAAVNQLRIDRGNGYPHLLMARCENKKRAEEVVRYYQAFEDLRTVVVYNGVPQLAQKIRDIKEKLYDIIICIDMLGEGFDLPELKIAAIHDERQSIPVTLQFVGRFTRSSFETLGQASFIANIAYPPILAELDRLYAHDADWNLLLPNLSAEATDRQINFQTFLDGFNNLDDSTIPFQLIRPAMSTMIYQNGVNNWNPLKWKEGVPNIESYDRQYGKVNGAENILVIILGKVFRVEWGDFDTISNIHWDMIVVLWDLSPGINRVFVNFSMDNFNPKKLVTAIFNEENELIKGMDVFRIFHDVKRLYIFNFGGRPGSGIDISFRAFFGRGIQDGLNLLEQSTLIKNNIFGAGYKDGNKVTLGCSVKGKIWSYQRGNLQELKEWCQTMGDIITDATIDPNTVLRHTLSPQIITDRPPTVPINVDWSPTMYGKTEDHYITNIDNRKYDLSSCELNLVNVPTTSPLQFSLVTEETTSIFELIIGQRTVGDKEEPFFTVNQIGGPPATIYYGGKDAETMTDFLIDQPPIIWFADGSQLMSNLYVSLKIHPGRIPLDNIIEDSWPGVDLSKESQGIAPYERDSIQYYFITKIIDDFEVVYDDDASGEIADVIGINDHDRYIDVHLYHLKFAIRGQVGNNIDNLYQVCGQAQKSLNWKYRSSREFFNHLLRRIQKKKNGNVCSRLLKGTEENLEKLLTAAKWQKEMRMHIYIAQPGFQKANVSDDILLLLGVAYHYLATVGNVGLKVYSS